MSLSQALQSDRTDHELVNNVLETLITVTSPEPFQDEIGEWFSVSRHLHTSDCVGVHCFRTPVTV